MKKPPIKSVNSSVNAKSKLSTGEDLISNDNNSQPNNDLKSISINYQIIFTGSAISKVRQLFQYGIPDMYSQRITIDPKLISKWLKNGMFSHSIFDVIKILEKYESSFIEKEKDLIEILKNRAKIHPNKTLHETLQEIRPVYSRILRKEQTPIFHRLWEEFEQSDPASFEKYKQLLEKSEKMLNDKPVIIPFSSYEFKYKLTKIKEDIAANADKKAKKVINKLIKESMKFANFTNENNAQYQKDVFAFLNHIRRRSVLKNNEQLTAVFKEAKSRLNRKEIIVPFRKKSFIYDLMKIIEKEPEPFQNKILNIAKTLPSSSDNFAAYLLKISTDTNEKIGYRIVWPSMATIEHLFPRSKGGSDDWENLGIASAIENSNRKSIDMTEQIARIPNTCQYTQRTINKLIELNNNGLFQKNKVPSSYIIGYAETVYEQSNHIIKLDTSGLKIA